MLNIVKGTTDQCIECFYQNIHTNNCNELYKPARGQTIPISSKTVKMLLSSYRWSFQQHLRTGIFYQSSTSSQGISENANFFKAFVNHHEFSCSELNSNCQRRDWLDTGEEWERNCERQKERLGGPMASTHPSFMQNIFYGSAVSQNKI